MWGGFSANSVWVKQLNWNGLSIFGIYVDFRTSTLSEKKCRPTGCTDPNFRIALILDSISSGLVTKWHLSLSFSDAKMIRFRSKSYFNENPIKKTASATLRSFLNRLIHSLFRKSEVAK